MDFNFLGAVRSALPKKKYWLMSMDDGSSDQPGSSRYSESTDNKDACQASLMQILESQIIPSLLASNEFVEPFYSTDGARTAIPTNTDEDAPDLFVQGLMAEGLSSEDIFLHLLAPAARHLGYLWEEDLCDFSRVTIALIRMQKITMRLGSDFQEKRKSAMEGMRALFAPVPGSQHTLGVLMVSEFFRREGWQVWMELGSSESKLLAAVKKDWFQVIGLSIGTEAHVESLTDTIKLIRDTSANKDVKILIGGPILATIPNLFKEVGADGAAGDAVSAVALAKSLFAL
jgi:methanogenic corrinoid protein MtbC1